MSRLWWVGKSKSKSKNNGEIQGSLHCALDGETVQRFGRDDVLLWGEGKQTTAKTEADPYGMTNKRTSNGNSNGQKNKQRQQQRRGEDGAPGVWAGRRLGWRSGFLRCFGRDEPRVRWTTMSLFFAAGSPTTEMSADEVKANLFSALDKLGARKKVLAVPPDFTRMHSQSGLLTELAWQYYGDKLVDVLPALGTHKAMTDNEIATMYGATPRSLFRVHDWRNDVVTLGEVPGEFLYEVSEGKVDYTWPAQVNKLLRDGGHDLILSIGQVVPHEVVGMANYNKSVYRTRMALADNAELIVLAPGVHEFGEDAAIDVLIRKYGYCGTPRTLEAVKEDPQLAGNLSAAAHLIHGSSEGRFTIRYCPGHLTREEIEGVHFAYGNLREMTANYNPELLEDGWNIVDGEEIFYISNPGLGLWAYKGRFND